MHRTVSYTLFVTINGAKKVIDIDGLPEMPIVALRLTDVVGSGKVSLQVCHTTNLDYERSCPDAPYLCVSACLCHVRGGGRRSDEARQNAGYLFHRHRGRARRTLRVAGR